MDKLSSVIAAIDAGKIPTQKQVDDAIDWSLQNIIAGVESPDMGKLSEPGKVLARGLRDLLLAYRQLGTKKNCNYFHFPPKVKFSKSFMKTMISCKKCYGTYPRVNMKIRV